MGRGIINCKVLDKGIVAIEKQNRKSARNLVNSCKNCNCAVKADLLEVIGNRKEASKVRDYTSKKVNREYRKIANSLNNLNSEYL